jgi:hypothetical protein
MSDVNKVPLHDFGPALERQLPGPVRTDDDVTDPVEDMSAVENVGNEIPVTTAQSVGAKEWNGLVLPAQVDKFKS